MPTLGLWQAAGIVNEMIDREHDPVRYYTHHDIETNRGGNKAFILPATNWP
ncbi:MAG: hypothetical protein R2788_25775 [Saprospiraceae bacterium]